MPSAEQIADHLANRRVRPLIECPSASQARSAYTGVLFTEDLDKGEGSLWPSARTRTALGRAYGDFEGSTRHYQAVYEDHVRSSGVDKGDGIDGWGLVARWRRAGVLATRYDAPAVTSATVAVTVTVEKSGSPLTTALVAYAGNYGPKTQVDGNGQITFQVPRHQLLHRLGR